jgi:aspartate racemase
MHLRIGILGGLSAESTVTYYEHITRSYAERYGDYAYPEIVIYSVNFQQYVDWQKDGRWAEAADAMVCAIESLRSAGSDFGLIATNTMHIVFEEVQARVGIPLLSIVDATAEAIARRRLRRVGLLGTVFTMREAFYRDGLEKRGIESVVPPAVDMDLINRVIYRELCRGDIREASRREFQRMVAALQDDGAEGVVLGCTEIPLLLRPEDVELPLFNTTLVHAEAALARSVGRR